MKFLLLKRLLPLKHLQQKLLLLLKLLPLTHRLLKLLLPTHQLLLLQIRSNTSSRQMAKSPLRRAFLLSASFGCLIKSNAAF